MKTKKILYLILFGIIFKPEMSFGWVDSTLFSPKLFIENKGQFDNASYLKEFPEILFAVNHSNTKIFFSPSKIAIALFQSVRDENAFIELQKSEEKKTESQKDIDEKRALKNRIYKINTSSVFIEWLSANPGCKIEASDVADEYFNYEMDKDIRHDINFVKGYKKIIYKNIYDEVDIEYVFHEKSGIKYNIVVQPGADISKIKLKYSGAQNISLDDENNVIIKTSIGNIIDHAPVSFQDNAGIKIKTKFVLQNNILSFTVDDYDKSKTLVIDPWISTTLPQLDTAYEVAVDPAGNVWVYGDFDSQVKKYDNTGAPLWTFLSGPGYLYNPTLIGGDLAVDPAGNSYCSGSECVRKLSPAGISLWLYAPVRNITNIACCETGWRMVFDPANNRLYGGGSNGQTKATWYDPATGNPMWLPNGWNACNIIQGPCPSGCPNANGEIRHITLAPNGNFYAYTAVGDSSTATSVSTITGFDPNFVGIYRSCNVPASPYWTIPFQPSSPTYYVGCYYMANGIAASNCYIYIYTGSQVQKFDIYAPTFLGSSNIAGGILYMNSGILADLMNNFYVGTQNGISAYSPTFNLITSVVTPKPVYDMAFAPGNNIAACGIGFVGVFANIVQTGAPIICNPSPNLPISATADTLSATGCNSNNAMAWVDTIMNGTGPYTYSWSNGATTDTISNLAPGNYTCTIYDASCPQEITTVSVTIPASSSPTITTTSTNVLCFSNTNGSANATVTGGSSPYTYQWSPSGGNSSSATGLAAGNYTVVVTDANGCTSAQTVTITQPTALTTTISSTSATCGGNNGTATVAVAGGNGSYAYLWTPSSSVTATATGLSTGNYSVTVTDANGCTTVNTVSVTSTGSITAIAGPNSTICSGQNATMSASGGNNYSWSSGQTTSSITIAPATSTNYTVIVSSGSCLDTAYVTVTVNPTPILSVSGNTVLCIGDTAILTATGGTNYSWSTSSTVSTIVVSPSTTTTYTVTTSNASCTSTTSITVVVSGPPTANATGAIICSGQTALLTASGGATYSWSTGATTSSITPAPTSNTTYTVIVSTGSCSDTTSATVVVNPSPTATAWSNVTITQGQSTTLSASGGGSYTWSNGATGSNISVAPLIMTWYCVTVSNGNCIDTACVTVYVEPIDCGYADDQLFVPDAFSPNGDTKNDMLGVYYPNISCIKEFMFIIYDRWGEKIFEAEEMSVLWDGTYKGKPMNTAVFVYYMKVTFITGNETVRKGNVSLIR